MNEKLIAIAQEYETPEAFKVGNHQKYSICKSKGLLRQCFPDHVTPLKVWPMPLQAVIPEIPADADLRHAIDDLIVQYRTRQKDKGRSSTIYLGTVIRDLSRILKKY